MGAKGKRGLTRRRLLGALAGVGAAGAVYAFGIEPEWLRIAHREITLAHLPPELDGYRIAHLSDLHAGATVRRAYLDDAVAAANAARPDLAVVTGDLVDESGRSPAAPESAAVLARLAARDGVLAVFGNHDTGAFHPGRPVDRAAMANLTGLLRDAGIQMLENDVREIERDGGRMLVAGYGDLWSGRFEPAGVPTPLIALSHNPDTAPELVHRGAALVLSGHTHGGQVCVPWFGAPYVPVRHKEFLHGHYRLGRGQLHVNPGLGYSYRVRFCARPEVTILTLRSPRPRA